MQKWVTQSTHFDANMYSFFLSSYGRLESADHALFKMVRYVLLRPMRPELDGQDPFQTFQTLVKQFDWASPLSVKKGS
jgi:hypothetical protein